MAPPTAMTWTDLGLGVVNGSLAPAGELASAHDDKMPNCNRHVSLLEPRKVPFSQTSSLF